MVERIRRSSGVPRGYRIRPARRAEIHRLPRIERAAASRFVAFGLGERTRLTTPLEVLEGRQAAGRLWVASEERRERPVGFVTVTAIDGQAHLEELDVLPSSGRRGLGSALVGAVCDWARTRGFDRITLSTYREIPWNMPLYQRLGFSVMPRHSWSPGLRALRAVEARAGLRPAGRVLMFKPLQKVPCLIPRAVRPCLQLENREWACTTRSVRNRRPHS